MVVQHNISAMTANRYYGVNNKGLANSLEKLASGYAINKAGDNAAGLAVSEKMRAQIGGLTQASKNAEDGISMVQTFEGALQETDSILQRMRTLAVQSANGSYQDDVDRDAIQLEFDQLNDELNQIADTDFNGVVMLNGGRMADGLQAHNGKFDYATKKQDVTDAVEKNLTDKLNAANKELASAKTAYANSAYDLSAIKESKDVAKADEWHTVDNSQYNKDVADNLWRDLGLTKDGSTDADAKVDISKGNEVSVTFKLGEDGKWTADKGTVYLDGTSKGELTEDQLKAFTAEEVAATDDVNGLGGFKVKSTLNTASGSLGNAVADVANVKAGSTITLVYKNASNDQLAPNNVGIQDGTYKVTDGVGLEAKENDASGLPTIELNSDLKDSDMDQAKDDAFTAIEGLAISAVYGTGSTVSLKVNAGETELSSDYQKIDVDVTNDDGTTSTKSVYAKIDSGKITFSSSNSDDDKLLDVTLKDTADTNAKSGTVSFKLSVAEHKFEDNSASITLKAGDDPDLASSSSQYAKVKAAATAAATAKTALDDFNKLSKDNDEDWAKIKEMYASSQSSSGAVVSVSDNLDNSRAKMTYTDQMSLQVGARTKDLVNFTFSYSSDDLGGLEKNLDCSSREGGLNTANLSVSTASDANNAIDQIDKALNKVNMVRATFGAVQNRLEHKINNIDTNTENMTAAESRIRDTQMDKEMMKFTSAQILSQASQSMLAQANQLPQGVLQLLG